MPAFAGVDGRSVVVVPRAATPTKRDFTKDLRSSNESSSLLLLRLWIIVVVDRAAEPAEFHLGLLWKAKAEERIEISRTCWNLIIVFNLVY